MLFSAIITQENSRRSNIGGILSLQNIPPRDLLPAAGCPTIAITILITIAGYGKACEEEGCAPKYTRVFKRYTPLSHMPIP